MQARTLPCFLAVLVCCVCTLSTRAQILFESSTGLGGDVSLSEIELLPDGDLIMAGYSGDSLLLVRSTALGDVVWSRVYPGIGKPNGLHVTPGGGISINTVSYQTHSIHLFESTNGDSLQTLNDASFHSWVTEDSLVYVATDQLPAPRHLNYGHINGGVLWSIQAPSDSIEFSQPVLTSSGNVVVLGGKIFENFVIPKPWLGRYTSTGVFLDSTEYYITQGGSPTIHQITTTSDGGYLVYGDYGSVVPRWIKGDQNGEVTSVLEALNNLNPGTTGIVCFNVGHTSVRSNGNYVCAANLQCDEPYPPRAIIEIDTNGVITCVRVFPSVYLHELFGDIVIGPEGNSYLVGTRNLYGANGRNDTWMGIATICEDQVVVVENEAKEPFSVYPQPSTGVFTIQLDATCNNPFTAEVYDTFGKRVAQYRVNSPSFTIDLTNHEPGVYQLRVTDGKGQGWSTVLLRVE